jgi:DNA replication protein DnaC
MKKRKQTPKPKIRPPHPVEDVMPGVISSLQRMERSAAQFRENWHAWFARSTDHTSLCPTHKSVMMLDGDASVAESFRRGREGYVAIWRCDQCEAEKKEMAILMPLSRAGVPSDMLACSLANWRPHGQGEAQDLAVVKKWASNPRGALILFGQDVGTGKTHLAVACLREAIQRGDRGGRFLTHTAFVRKLRDSYGDDRAPDVIRDCIAARFLVIDDLGLTSGGRDEMPAIHEVLDCRKAESRPFVITGNFNDMGNLALIVGDRMMDRLREFTFAAIHLTGPSRRHRRV